MAVKKFNPLTPGQRFRVAVSRDELTKGAKPEKSLQGYLRYNPNS